MASYYVNQYLMLPFDLFIFIITWKDHDIEMNNFGKIKIIFKKLGREHKFRGFENLL